MSILNRRLSRFTAKNPELIFEWKDRLSEAQGWLIINSIKNGAAKSKVYIKKGITKEKLENYAKQLEVSLTISGPPVGGAAIGLDFDREDTRYQSILDRFFKILIPIFRDYCGLEAGENISEAEVELQCNKFGLLHSWEGIVEGYLSYVPDNKFRSTIRALHGFEPYTTEEKLGSISRLQQRYSMKLTDERFIPDDSHKYTVDEIIAGWGIAESIRHYYMIYGGFINNKFVLVHDWNAVTSVAALFLCKYGALIAGILDKTTGLISARGLSHEELPSLNINPDENEVSKQKEKNFEDIEKEFWDVPAEIFIAGSPTSTISQIQAEKLVKSGVEVVACGVDDPFDCRSSYVNEVSNFLDSKLSIIHPIISNSGKARLSAYLLKKESKLNDMEVIKDVSEIIRQSIMRLHQFNPRPTGIFSKALELSLTDLV